LADPQGQLMDPTRTLSVRPRAMKRGYGVATLERRQHSLLFAAPVGER